MRILIASIIHETNTFSPVATPLSRFGVSHGRAFLSDDAIARLAGSDREIAGFVDVLTDEGMGFDIIEPAEAVPSGPVPDEVLEELIAPVERAARSGRYAAILLCLHGAMVAVDRTDGDGWVITRLRAAAPDLPIVATFDMHANLSEAATRPLLAACGYRTYPHIDCAATGRRAARILAGYLKGEVWPVMEHQRLPLLTHVMAQASGEPPNSMLQTMVEEISASGEVMDASLFTGFPHADSPQTGVSIVVVADRDSDVARKVAGRIADAAWALRDDFSFSPEPLASSIQKALAQTQSPGGPVIFLDHCDNAASGGTMDSTTVLAAMLQAGVDHAAFFGIFDPAAVRACMSAGLGATVSLTIGAKVPVAWDYARSEPLKATGTVTGLFQGVVRRHGPFAANTTTSIGETAILRIDGIDVVLLSRQVEPADLGYFHALNIDPARLRAIGLKSRVHWRAGFSALPHRVIPCNGSGVCISDHKLLDYHRLARPIYPLDKHAFQEKVPAP